MERKLRMLDSFSARGSDGATYKVRAYEHLVRDESMLHDGHDHWESTGESEYRLDDGTRVDLLRDGAMRVAGSGLTLQKT